MFNLQFFKKRADRDSDYEEGRVCEVIRQGHKWRVEARGSYWFATSKKNINVEVGAYVRIVGTQGIGLLIDST